MCLNRLCGIYGLFDTSTTPEKWNKETKEFGLRDLLDVQEDDPVLPWIANIELGSVMNLLGILLFSSWMIMVDSTMVSFTRIGDLFFPLTAPMATSQRLIALSKFFRCMVEV